MGANRGGHAHALLVEVDSPIHRLPAAVKIVAAFLFVLAVVATPREAFWAFGVDAAVLLALIAAARIRPDCSYGGWPSRRRSSRSLCSCRSSPAGPEWTCSASALPSRACGADGM